MAGIVLAQGGQAEDRRIAVYRRIQQQFTQMPAQLKRWRVARHGLAEIDQRVVGRKAPARHPALGFAYWRGLDSRQPRIGRRLLMRRDGFWVGNMLPFLRRFHGFLTQSLVLFLSRGGAAFRHLRHLSNDTIGVRSS